MICLKLQCHWKIATAQDVAKDIDLISAADTFANYPAPLKG